MHKRIFLKYYSVCVLIVFLTVSILGISTSAAIGVRNFNTQSESMERAANKVAHTVATMPKNFNILAGSIFESSITTIKDTIKSDIVVYDHNANAQFSTLTLKGQKTDPFIPQTVVADVLSGNVYRRSRSFSMQGASVGYTVGVPVMTDDNKVGGAVFVTTKDLNITSIFLGNFLLYITCGIAVLIIAFIALIFISRQMTQPIYQMYNAANAYAKGDFSKRIKVRDTNEFAPLARAFNSMADGIESLDDMRKGFVADVSHELRTPMTTITGFIDGILDGTIPESEREKYLTIVSDEAHRMSRMVSAFLDIAKLQSGQMTFVKKPFDIIESTGKVLFAFEDKITQNGINLSFNYPDEPVIAVGDYDAIYRVIYNLVDNAIKFTDEGGNIEINITVNDKKVNVSVYNTGYGISKEDAAHIFERFYKADKSRGLNKKGTGIGLFLVKNIIKEHGEDIILSSKEGEFAKFTFTLELYTD